MGKKEQEEVRRLEDVKHYSVNKNCHIKLFYELNKKKYNENYKDLWNIYYNLAVFFLY